MTTEALQAILVEAADLLTDNKQTITPAMLDVIEQLAGFLQSGQPIPLEGSFGSIKTALAAFVKHERTLLQTPMTDNLLGAISRLQSHPIILGMVAKVL